MATREGVSQHGDGGESDRSARAEASYLEASFFRSIDAFESKRLRSGLINTKATRPSLGRFAPLRQRSHDGCG